MRRRLLAAAAVVILAVSAAAGPAQAGGPAVTADRKGDGLGPGDVRALRLEQINNVLRIQVRTEKPINLRVAPAWHRHGSTTLLRVFLETHAASPGPDGRSRWCAGLPEPSAGPPRWCR